MTTVTTRVTAEELLALPDPKSFELYDGELRTVSPANARHGDIASQIGMLLRQYVSPRKLGRVMIGAGYVLARNPDSVLGPDVSFLAQARIPAAGLPEKSFEGSPDLAVEIISPTNPRREIEKKMQRYFRAGTLLRWVVDPTSETVHLHRPNAPVHTVSRRDTISGEMVIPGFSCNVAEFFA
jgi:Uma2 family endonuclease